MERKQEFMPIKEVKEKRRNLEKKFLRYQEAEHVYSIQHKKLFELASKAGAIYRIDGYVLINRDIFNEYLEQFHEPAQNMSGNIWMYSYDIDEQDIDMLQRDFITFKQGAEYYKMGMKPFIRICRESGAVYKIGKMVRVNRHILEQHIRKLRLKEEK